MSNQKQKHHEPPVGWGRILLFLILWVAAWLAGGAAVIAVWLGLLEINVYSWLHYNLRPLITPIMLVCTIAALQVIAGERVLRRSMRGWWWMSAASLVVTGAVLAFVRGAADVGHSPHLYNLVQLLAWLAPMMGAQAVWLWQHEAYGGLKRRLQAAGLWLLTGAAYAVVEVNPLQLAGIAPNLIVLMLQAVVMFFLLTRPQDAASALRAQSARDRDRDRDDALRKRDGAREQRLALPVTHPPLAFEGGAEDLSEREQGR